jgi:ankyrin repeat protein
VFNAAATNDTVTLARLLKTLPGLKDLRAPNGMTALHVAAIWNAPDTARLLIRAGMDINGRDATAETPLHSACRFPQNSMMVRLLLDAGANPNVRNLDGDMPIHLAVRAASPGLMRLLLAHKAAPDLPNGSGRTPLDLVFDDDSANNNNNINSNSISIVTLLLNAGADPNTPFLNGYDLLSQAIARGNAALVALLIAKGADVNYLDKIDGDSSLMKAVYWGNKDIIGFLLDKGADINYKNRYGQSALDMARDNSAISDLLKQRGAKD